MTIEEQRNLFTVLQPEEFMDVCMMHIDKYGFSMPVCSYVSTRIRKELGKILSQKEIAYQQNLEQQFGDLDIEPYRKFYVPNQRNDIDPSDIIKDVYSELQNEIKKVHNPNKGKNYSAFFELIKALKENLDFSSDDTEKKTPKYGSDKRRELYKIIDEFHGKTYQLTKDISIRLAPKELMHIVVGHIRCYQIPRKGKMIPFEFIYHWEHLLSFIDSIIFDFIKNDLITHYSNMKTEYNNTNIRISDKRFGIHIGKHGNIRTFYQIDEGVKYPMPENVIHLNKVF